MGTGAITQYVDVAQLVLYAFWIFFFGLIFYLQRESKREGYPMHSEVPGRPPVPGLLPMPTQKTYKLFHGGVSVAPHDRDAIPAELAATPVAPFPGAAIEPIGNPIGANIGPGSYTARLDVPELNCDSEVRILPMRKLPETFVSPKGPDPRGMPVIGEDGQVGGTVRDIWIDHAERVVRYYELNVPGAAMGPQVLLPANFARITGGKVQVKSLYGKHFANVPRTKHPDQVTSLEEDKVMAYYGGGSLYANPERQEPLI
jgi:photosynthetic reaction center H subunit